MDKERIASLRRELSCTRRELAATLGVEPNLVAAWERGERFPTKRITAMLESLRQKGPRAVLDPSRESPLPAGVALLEDPRLWSIVRKLLEDPDFFARVVKLMDGHQTPVEKSDR